MASLSKFLPSGKEKKKTQEEKLSLAHEFLARYHTVKIHSWRGNLKRIFCVGKQTVATIDPSALFKLTNEWKYGVGFFDSLPKTGSTTDFTITVGAGKLETMLFSSNDRSELLTEIQKQRKRFASKDQATAMIGGRKLRWNEEYEPTLLALAAHGVQQLNSTDANQVRGCYDYYKIVEVGVVSDVPNGLYIVYSEQERLHLFTSERRDELLKKIPEMSLKYIGHTGIKRGEDVTMAQAEKRRLGPHDPAELVSSSEFSVNKVTARHAAPVKRTLCITEQYLVERDTATYNVVTLRKLREIFALIRSEDDSQLFLVEYKDNSMKRYSSTDRDSLLASLQDAVRRAGNLHCCIKMSTTDRGQRTGSLKKPVPESIESTLLKVMGEYDMKSDRDIITYPQVIRYFNNNVEYSGLMFTETKDALFAENKEKMIQTAITALLVHSSENPTPEMAADQFYALRRLAASPTGFEAFTKIPGFVKKIGKSVVTGLKMRHDAVSHAAIDFLAALLYPMHQKYDVYQEQQNRAALLHSPPFLSQLVALLRQHAQANTGALVVSALLDFFVFSLCPPYSDTTHATHFTTLLELLAEGAGPAMFRLYLHPCMALGIASGMLMKTIIQECESQTERLQRYALSEGTLLRQFYLAMYGKNNDQRELAVQLIGLWTVECPDAQELFKRMVPMPLLAFLQSKKKVPVEEGGKPEHKSPTRPRLRSATGIAESHWRIKMGVPTPLPQPPEQPPVTIRKQKELVQVSLNWEYFFHQMKKDHLRPDVVWNHHTREELREKIERELGLLGQGMDTRRGQEYAWNHVEFEVIYECLKDEIQIGKHFLRLLLEDPDPQIHNPKEFFYDLYHRFLLVTDKSLKAQCMHGMARLYETHAASIGVFNDLSFIVGMLRDTTDTLERDRLLQFLGNLLRVKGNVKLFIDCQGVPILIDLLTLAHLHHDRAQLRTQSNVIEMNPDEVLGTEPEWYYQDAEGQQSGPISLETVEEMRNNGEITDDTRMWGQGLDAWQKMSQIPQFKWNILYKAPGILNPTELSSLVLDMLIRMCGFYPSRNEDGVVIRPLPRFKRMLSEPTVLPHIAQMFLTLDPTLCNKTARLLCELMRDNPHSAARLYLTGAFFFALMYMGSDIKPLVTLLHLTHDKQAFTSDQGNSILSPMLPQAMVCFLSNHGVEKFSEVFLGEFDNPEAIWGNEMRHCLVQSISGHLMEFTPKLRSNTRAIYTFCPITPVVYASLENELFCNQYYLRHLCDLQRFPDWEITNPVELLRDALRDWKTEVDKQGQPTGLSRAKALEALELPEDSTPEPAKVRKAYFVLAAKFHPDKNPDGRERFEEILKAYEFLANPNQPLDTPDPRRIDLLIRAQSILYRRFTSVLSPYKYAGYPMLLVHVEAEASDPQLFAMETPLLPAAAELCLHTVKASPLNAEELLREGGLDLLRRALERCGDVIGVQSADGEMPVQVATSVTNTFAVAANFETCRDAMQEMPNLVKLVTKGVTCKNAPRLAKATIAACSYFAAGEKLQDQLYESGILWHLIEYVFGYDYTLDEADVEKSAETNVQEMKNMHAKASLFTICRLCGFMNGVQPHKKFAHTLSLLLTPYVVAKLRSECKGEAKGEQHEVLKLLNSNSETPYMLWNNGTRAELQEFLTSAQEASMRGEEVVPRFVYSAHQKELFVGGIFVRLFNAQPNFVIRDPARFAGRLVQFIEQEKEGMPPLEEGTQMGRIGACIEALKNIITQSGGAVESLMEHFKMLFSILGVATEQVACVTCELLILCSQSHDVVVKVSEIAALTPLILCASRHRGCVALVMQLLFALSAATKGVAEMLDKGAYIIPLYEFATTRVSEIRESSAQLIGKLVTDKLHGPKIALRSGKVMPSVFIESMKENASSAAMMFDGTSENPELIWTLDMRDRCVHLCETLREDVVKTLLADEDAVWRLPADVGVAHSVEELQIGGVYLHLYVKQPGWGLRNPRKFLTALFDEFFVKAAEDPVNEEVIELIAKSLVCLLNAESVLADQVPQLGHVPKLFAAVSQQNAIVGHAALQIIHQLALSRTVVERCICQANCIQPISDYVKREGLGDDKLGNAIETVERMMVRNNYEMGCIVKRALDCDLPNHLIQVLSVTPSASIRAVSVKALKAMSSGSSPNCQTVKELLDACPQWASHQSQNHDLFLTKDTFAGYLTGPSSQKGPVLSLTGGPATASAAHSSAPPPIEDAAAAARAAQGSSPPATDTQTPEEKAAAAERAAERAAAAAATAAKKAADAAAAAAAAATKAKEDAAEQEAKKAAEEAAAAAAAAAAATPPPVEASEEQSGAAAEAAVVVVEEEKKGGEEDEAAAEKAKAAAEEEEAKKAAADAAAAAAAADEKAKKDAADAAAAAAEADAAAAAATPPPSEEKEEAAKAADADDKPAADAAAEAPAAAAHADPESPAEVVRCATEDVD